MVLNTFCVYVHVHTCTIIATLLECLHMSVLPSVLIVLILSVVIYGPMCRSGYRCAHVHTHVCSLVSICACVVCGSFNYFFLSCVKERKDLNKNSYVTKASVCVYVCVCVGARIYRTAVVKCSSTRISVSEVLAQIHTGRCGLSRSH